MKDGRKVLKRYGILSTCLASQAIHLKSANSLETDSFINGLRRFIAQRGPVRQIRSDQGTNIMGARKELKDGLKNMDHNRIQDCLCLHFHADWVIDSKPNPPAASHMGGVWERQIRGVKTILTTLMKEFGHMINGKCFSTLLVEAENTVNSRPLTFPTTDPDNCEAPLYPNSILTLISKLVMPPPDLYARKHWKRVQYLAEVFWFRWKKEYLNSLQERKK